MGGKSGGGSFAEKGTPLSAQSIAQRDAATRAFNAKQPKTPPGEGETGAGYSGAEVSEEQGKAALAGLGAFMGTLAFTGEPITSATMAYQAYSYMTPEDKAKVDTEAKTRGFSLSDLFGSLLGDDTSEEDSSASLAGLAGDISGGAFGDGFGGGFGEGPGSAGGSQGRGGSEGSYA